MKRRRVLIALAVLVGVAAFAAWKLTHRHDPQLVGRWLMTYDVRPSAAERAAATDPSSFAQKTEWRLTENGNGRADHNTLTTFTSFGWTKCRWWTGGDRLHIQWTSDRTGWAAIQENAEDLYRILRGGPMQHPVEEYAWFIESPDVIRIEPRDVPWKPFYQVNYLTRLPEDES